GARGGRRRAGSGSVGWEGGRGRIWDEGSASTARDGRDAMPKILILNGDAAESLEVMYPYQRLLEEGYEVDIAAPSVKKLQFVVHDIVDGFDTYTEKLGHAWPADLAFADVNPSDYVAVVVPGGRAPEYIRNDADV